MTDAVDTVALIVAEGGRVLVERRKLTKRTDPGKVAIPGGHVEEGESLAEACSRELSEELGLTCGDFKYVVTLPHRADQEKQNVHYYSCEDWSGTPICKEAEEIFWIDRDQFHVLDFEIDRKAIHLLFTADS